MNKKTLSNQHIDHSINYRFDLVQISKLKKQFNLKDVNTLEKLENFKGKRNLDIDIMYLRNHDNKTDDESMKKLKKTLEKLHISKKSGLFDKFHKKDNQTLSDTKEFFRKLKDTSSYTKKNRKSLSMIFNQIDEQNDFKWKKINIQPQFSPYQRVKKLSSIFENNPHRQSLFKGIDLSNPMVLRESLYKRASVKKQINQELVQQISNNNFPKRQSIYLKEHEVEHENPQTKRTGYFLDNNGYVSGFCDSNDYENKRSSSSHLNNYSKKDKFIDYFGVSSSYKGSATNRSNFANSNRKNTRTISLNEMFNDGKLESLKQSFNTNMDTTKVKVIQLTPIPSSRKKNIFDKKKLKAKIQSLEASKFDSLMGELKFLKDSNKKFSSYYEKKTKYNFNRVLFKEQKKIEGLNGQIWSILKQSIGQIMDL